MRQLTAPYLGSSLAHTRWTSCFATRSKLSKSENNRSLFDMFAVYVNRLEASPCYCIRFIAYSYEINSGDTILNYSTVISVLAFRGEDARITLSLPALPC